MMNIQNPSAEPLGWKKSFLWLALAVTCFHAAYTSLKLDRFLGPLCVGITAIVMVILLFLTWKDKRAKAI